LLGEAEDRIRKSVLDKTGNLVHAFAAEDFGIEQLRFHEIAAC
jgi:hypothetical protein